MIQVRHGRTLVRTDLGALAAGVREFDLRDRRTSGLGTLVDGRAPRTREEVAVSPGLAGDGFGPGRRIRLGPESAREVTVVGVVRNPASLRMPQVVGMPGAILTGSSPDGATEFLVDTKGRAITWSDVEGTQRPRTLRGVARGDPGSAPGRPDSREVTEAYTSGPDAATAAFAAVVTACILLEVVLLAGPAFAVGARRQSRQLALVVATGGTPKDVRRIVLAGAGVLGFGAALAGVVLAIVLVALTLPLSSHLIGHDIGPLDVAPLDLAALLVVGSLAAMAAAFVPARHASRQDTVVALAGRRGTTRVRRGWPLGGLALMAAGTAAAFLLGRRNGGEWLVVGGTFALVAGAIMATPAVIGLLGRLGGRLPLPLRLATRDSARNRSRTTPAVAAIMGVVTGVTALAIASASDYEQSRRDYRPRRHAGTMLVTMDSESSQAVARNLVGQVRTEIPGSAPVVLPQVPSYSVTGGSRSATLVDPTCEGPDPQECSMGPDIPGAYSTSEYDGLLVADPDTLASIVGQPLTPVQRRVLAEGGVLVPYRAALHPDQTVEVATYRQDAQTSGSVAARAVRRDRLPAAVLPGTVRGDEYAILAELVASPETTKRLGLVPAVHALVVPPGDRPVSHDQEDRVAEIAQGLGASSQVYVERGFVETYTVQFLGLALLGGLLVLVGTATATALALDDARPDLATLAAVGAAPRTRRRMAMAQAAVIGLLGAVFGVLVGAVPGVSVAWPLTAGVNGRTAPVIDIPWTLLGLVVVAVPLMAVVGAGVLTRSRLPMVRRAD